MTRAITSRRATRAAPVLITGGAGFIGSNLAERLASEGEDVLILDKLTRRGADENLAWLRSRHPARVTAIQVDVADAAAQDAVKYAKAVVHLAAQVAVTTSIDNPVCDFESNARGTLNMLEAARKRSEPIPFVFASTNKVYGDLAHLELELVEGRYAPCDPAVRRGGLDEQTPLSFLTPYGCSKGAADQYVLDYARTFGLKATSLRMSCIYGDRQHGTEDQGWLAHFLLRALEGRPLVIYGDGRQVRDALYVADAVEAYVRAMRQIGKLSGRAFNLGGGPENAVSLLDVLARTEEMLGHPIDVSFAPWRAGDQRYYVSNARAIAAILDLPPPLGWKKGLALLAHWLIEMNASPEVPRDRIAQSERMA